MMNRKIVITASVLGMLAIISGAFAAHGLKAILSEPQLEVWHTAVQYQFYHVFAMLFLSTINRPQDNLVRVAFYLFTFGIIFFSGSLYLLACNSALGWNLPAVIGIVTPIGGLLFIAGWATMALSAYRNK